MKCETEWSFDNKLCREYLYKNYQNLVIGFQVTVKNVGDVFLRHSVELDYIFEWASFLDGFPNKIHWVPKCLNRGVLRMLLVLLVFDRSACSCGIRRARRDSAV